MMLGTTVIIGLGQFGSRLATSLVSRNVPVLAIDRRAERVARVAPLIDRAVCLDATDEGALIESGASRAAVAVCALGEDAIQASIMVTALLSQMGVPRIVARSITELQARILLRVGAHEVINPEHDMGERLAQRLASPGLIDQIPLAENVSIGEVRAPESFVGRSLIELQVRKNFGLNVVAIRREHQGGTQVLPNPQANERIERQDVLFVIGSEPDIRRLADSAKVLR
jgi:trk system potassium uptake protein TrkA